MTADIGTRTVERCLSVVVPCFNEEATAEQSIRRLLQQPFVLEVIAVDDHSDDATPEVLSRIDDPRVRVIRHERNMGKGAALRTGFAATQGPFVGIHDADLEYDPADLGRLLKPLLDGQADVVYGSRFLTTEAHRVLYFWHSVGNKFLTLFSNMMTNLNLTDMETCYKVFRKDVLDRFTIEEDRFGVEPELTAKVAALGCRVFEIGISYHGRSYAEGKKIGWRDGMRAVTAVTKHSLGARLSERRKRRRPSEFDDADMELADTLESLEDAGNYVMWIGDQVRPYVNGRTLEVGAGHGTFSELLADWSTDLVITDPSARAVEMLRERHASRPGVTVECADLDHATELGAFDTIVLINVLEHIEDDEKALLRLAGALNPGGHLFLLVPAFELLYSDFDRRIGHHRRYRIAQLRRAVTDAGFEPHSTYYMNSIGFVAWLVTARLAGARPTRPGLIRKYDRVVVPVIRAFESVVRPPFGQSVVSIGRRPGDAAASELG